MAALATTQNQDRAVVTGGRNYFRTMGAGFGLASMYSSETITKLRLIPITVVNAIYQHDLSDQLHSIKTLSSNQRSRLLSSALEYLRRLTPVNQQLVLRAYSHSLKMVFVCFTAIAVACALTSLLIKVRSDLTRT